MPYTDFTNGFPQRLPDEQETNWGSVLNDFMLTSHAPNGALRTWVDSAARNALPTIGEGLTGVNLETSIIETYTGGNWVELNRQKANYIQLAPVDGLVSGTVQGAIQELHAVQQGFVENASGPTIVGNTGKINGGLPRLNVSSFGVQSIPKDPINTSEVFHRYLRLRFQDTGENNLMTLEQGTAMFELNFNSGGAAMGLVFMYTTGDPYPSSHNINILNEYTYNSAFRFDIVIPPASGGNPAGFNGGYDLMINHKQAVHNGSLSPLNPADIQLKVVRIF